MSIAVDRAMTKPVRGYLTIWPVLKEDMATLRAETAAKVAARAGKAPGA